MTTLENLRQIAEGRQVDGDYDGALLSRADARKLLALVKAATDVDTVHFTGDGEAMKRMHAALRALEAPAQLDKEEKADG